jgi:hypothetical protein
LVIVHATLVPLPVVGTLPFPAQPVQKYRRTGLKFVGLGTEQVIFVLHIN